MPLRLFVLAILAPLLFAGCMTQRDSADMEEETPPVGGPPNVSTYVYGTWDYTMTALDGSDTMSGLLTISEEGPGRFTTSTGLDAPLEAQEVNVTAPSFLLDATVRADQSFGFSLAGSVTGDTMEAEANLDGMGTYRLTAMRVRE